MNNMISACQEAKQIAFGIIASMTTDRFEPNEIREVINRADIWEELSERYKDEIVEALDYYERDYCDQD